MCRANIHANTASLAGHGVHLENGYRPVIVYRRPYGIEAAVLCTEATACARLAEDLGLVAAGKRPAGSNVRFQNEQGELDYVWQTSWGVSTRLVGGLIMCHGDDTGLVLPPKLAPIQVVVVPIWKGDDPKERILETAGGIADRLKALGLRVIQNTLQLLRTHSESWSPKPQRAGAVDHEQPVP